MTATLLTIATTDANAGGGDIVRSVPSFRDWLAAQEHRDDEIGLLASCIEVPEEYPDGDGLVMFADESLCRCDSLAARLALAEYAGAHPSEASRDMAYPAYGVVDFIVLFADDIETAYDDGIENGMGDALAGCSTAPLRESSGAAQGSGMTA